DRRRLKQAADRYLNIKARTDAADQTRRQQRMPAKRKEVVVDPDTLQPQYLGKQRAQQLLSRIARQTQNPSTNLRRRQRPAVKLPSPSSERTPQTTPRARHQVAGPPPPNMPPHPPPPPRPPPPQNNIPNNLQTPPPTRAPTHNRLRHSRVPNQRRLDLP